MADDNYKLLIDTTIPMYSWGYLEKLYTHVKKGQGGERERLL